MGWATCHNFVSTSIKRDVVEPHPPFTWALFTWPLILIVGKYNLLSAVFYAILIRET